MATTKPTIAIIGAGSVGSTIAYSIMLHRIPIIVHLVDIDAQLARSQAMDLSDVEFLMLTQVALGIFQQASKCDVIVIAAGERQKPGESHLQYRDHNVSIIKKIIDDIQPINPHTVILVVTDLVDYMTKVAQEYSELPHSQVFGSGTFLDTMRLCRHLSSLLSVYKSAVHCDILGEHGKDQFVCWLQATIDSTPIAKFTGVDKFNLKDIEYELRQTASNIIDEKGFTCFGIGAGVVQLVEDILYNSKEIRCVSCWSESFGVVLSMPTVVGSKGAELVMHVPLDEREGYKLQSAVRVIKT